MVIQFDNATWETTSLSLYVVPQSNLPAGLDARGNASQGKEGHGQFRNQFDPGPGLCYFFFMGNKHFVKSLGDGGNKRLRFNLETRKGRVVNFLVQLEFRLKNKWLPVVRYDFFHGFPHRDVLNQRGAEEKTPLKLETLEQCVQYAEQDLSDRYEWYLDRFLKN